MLVEAFGRRHGKLDDQSQKDRDRTRESIGHMQPWLCLVRYWTWSLCLECGRVAVAEALPRRAKSDQDGVAGTSAIATLEVHCIAEDAR